MRFRVPAGGRDRVPIGRGDRVPAGGLERVPIGRGDRVPRTRDRVPAGRGDRVPVGRGARVPRVDVRFFPDFVPPFAAGFVDLFAAGFVRFAAVFGPRFAAAFGERFAPAFAGRFAPAFAAGFRPAFAARLAPAFFFASRFAIPISSFQSGAINSTVLGKRGDSITSMPARYCNSSNSSGKNVRRWRSALTLSATRSIESKRQCRIFASPDRNVGKHSRALYSGGRT